jgi:hypothetical protein
MREVAGALGDLDRQKLERGVARRAAELRRLSIAEA